MKYDFLIVGAGIYGATFANIASKRGKKCIIIDRREHIGGNIYTENIESINVHVYGAHIFHTNNKTVWEYVNQFAEFNNYINSPIALYKNELYNLPFNMNTFSKMWGIKTPDEARSIIELQRRESGITEPKNLEEQALFLVGRDIYEKLIKGYTEKQWGRDCTALPAEIIKRLPLRYTYDNNYFNARYQGIPIGGYTNMVNRMLGDTDVLLGVDYKNCDIEAHHVIYTGAIDEFFDYRFGSLEYRSVKFDTKILETMNFQGNAVVNYTEREIPYTRIIEHKHFEFGTQEKTVITYEYPSEWKPGDAPYYPVNDEKNNALYEKYCELAKDMPHVTFAGRLGEYKYYDMDKTIERAMETIQGVL